MNTKKFFQHKIIKKILISVFFILLPISIIYPWFSHGTIIYFWDELFPLNPSNNLYHFFYLWKASVFPGNFDPGWSWLQYFLQIFLLNKLFHSLSSSQAVLYWLFLFFSLINFYLLVKKILKEFTLSLFTKESIAILGAILYTFNIYVYYYSFRIFNPQEYIIAFLPLNFLSLIQIFPLDKKETTTHSKKNTIWFVILFFFSLFLMVPGFSSIIFFAEYLVFIFLYLTLFVLSKPLQFKKLIKASFFYLLIVVFNIWWVFPMVLAARSVYSLSAGIGSNIYFTLNSQLSNLLNVLRIIGLPPMQTPIFPWESIYAGTSIYAFSLFIFPFLVLLLALFINNTKSKKLLIFLFITFLIFLFIAKEANPPLSFILQFGFNHIPFFGVFRDAYHKAGIYYVFSYFILITYALAVLATNHKQKALKNIFIIILLFASALMIAPFFFLKNIPSLSINKKNNPDIRFSAKTKIPPEYYEIKNKIEKSCDGTQVLVIPKTSILSSAYWPKNGTNYIGQDILHNIINCNFIVSQTSNNPADAYFSMPYLSIQKDDIAGLKKFIEKTNTKIILVRKDYAPNEYTDTLPVDIQRTLTLLNSDSYFKKTYENQYFTLFQAPTIENKFGFSIPNNIIASNVDFTNGQELFALFNLAKDKDTQFQTIDNKDNSQKLASTQKVIFGKCVGCEYLPNAANADASTLTNLKTNIVKKVISKAKNILGKKDTTTLDEQIINMERQLQTAIQEKKKGSTEGDQDLKLYNSMLESIADNLEEPTKDEFQKDYDFIKVRNFVKLDYKAINQYILDNQDDNLALQTFYKQQSILNNLNNQIWETDFKKQTIRYRLDISENDNYTCDALSNKKDIHITSYNLANNSNQNTTAWALNQGSYKVNVTYQVDKILNQKYQFKEEKFSVKKIELKSLAPNSYYKVSLNRDASVSSMMTIIVSRRNISETQPEKIVDGDYNSIIYKTRVYPVDFKNTYEDYFFTNIYPKDTYYIYIINEANQKQTKDTSFPLELSVAPVPTTDSIQFICINEQTSILPPVDFSIKKQNPYKYEIDFINNPVNRVLTFNQAYNSFWQAYTLTNGKKQNFAHNISEGYANSWYIDKPNIDRIFIEFTAQSLSQKIAIASIIGFFGLLIIYLFFIL